MENQQEKTTFLIDVSSEPGYLSRVHVNGNQGVLVDALIQVFECAGNEALADIISIALEEFYNKYPERRLD